MKSPRTGLVAVGIVLVLILGTMLIYWPVRHHEFVEYDDDEYITKNEPVTRGLTGRGITWAFTQSHAGNWHPLTWISHMVDVQLFGLNPGPQHLMSVAIHSINAALVFVWLAGATGARWRSALVAGLFAWHPLHVESVAWAAERKDVLSAFFCLLTLIAYGRYVARPSAWRYGVTLGLFALGLMAKSMLVTLPCVLLLLDFWPLARWPWPAKESASKSCGLSVRSPHSFWILLKEKIPFFALTMACSMATYWAQSGGGAVIGMEKIPVASRISNALVSYQRYLQKAFWPTNLAVFYPHPMVIPWAEIIIAAIFLIAVTVLVFRFARSSPYLVTGWLWYLGMLVPVIGLVQVGSQAMADRYTYLPLIGIFIMVAWGVPQLLEGMPGRGPVLAIASGAALVACLILTSLQLPVWQNSFALFDHAQRVVPNNYLARLHIAMFDLQNDRIDEALEYYGIGLAQKPDDADGRVGYGLALVRKGRIEEAVPQFRKALQLKPNLMEAHFNLGLALVAQKKTAEALDQLAEAIRLKPDQKDVRYGYAEALWDLEKYPDAIQQYQIYLASKPATALDHSAMAVALSRLGRLDEAAGHFEESLRLKPDQSVPHYNLGMMLARQRKFPEAIAHFRKALEADAKSPETNYQLGMALIATGDAEHAAASFREANRLRPDWVVSLNALAWILSTHENPQVRNGQEALQLATRANEKAAAPSAWYLSTLSAAQAEIGEFDQAVATAQRAMDLVSASTNKNVVAQFQQRLGILKNRQPLRDPTLSRPK